MNALGKRTFNGDRLKDMAIQRAFYEGACRGKQDIVGLYCEHPAITSEEYAHGLHESWNNGKPNQVFPFLLKQADQGDLDKAKEKYADGMKSSVKPLAKHPNQSHPQDQDISAFLKRLNLQCMLLISPLIPGCGIKNQATFSHPI